MATATTTAELIKQLSRIDGKAEIVGGEIVLMSATGDMPSSASGNIYVSLHEYAKHHDGRAYPDNAAFVVDLGNRNSFCPDASYHLGPRSGMKFLQGAPVFAVEVRSEGDYGKYSERRMADKQADYFAAGTIAVWNVDLDSNDDVVRLYTAASETPTAVFGRGQIAHAEPAVPGWTMPVDEIFE